MRLSRYRVLRPLLIAGRIAAVSEVVRLPEGAAAEFVESGHLRELDEAPANGSQWTHPMTRTD